MYKASKIARSIILAQTIYVLEIWASMNTRRVANASKGAKTALEARLVSAVISELEREYLEYKENQKAEGVAV